MLRTGPDSALLRTWFNGVRDGMEDANYYLTGPRPAAEVAAAMRCWPMRAYTQKLQLV